MEGFNTFLSWSFCRCEPVGRRGNEVAVVTITRANEASPSSDFCPLCGGAEFATVEEESVVTWLNYTCSQCGLTCEIQIGPESPILTERLAEWSSLFPND